MTHQSTISCITKPIPTHKLRKWQKDCINEQIKVASTGGKEFFVAAGVGSGKSIQSLSLYLKHDFELIIIVTPKSGIRGSWLEDAKLLNLVIEPILNSDAFLYNDNSKLNGFVLTAGMLPNVVSQLNDYTEQFKTLVIIDEAHHFAEDMSWLESAKAALSGASFTVALSGTPYRTDNNKIICLDYLKQSDESYATPGFYYQYEQALTDGLVSPVTTRFISGSVTKKYDDGRSIKFDYDDGDYSEQKGTPDLSLMGERLRLSAVESLEWQQGAIKESRKALLKYRLDGNPWAGLIIASTIEQAHNIADFITSEYGDKSLVVVENIETETAVELFNSDDSYLWVIAITKISEGVSIPRLRTLTMLTNVTTRTQFEQLRGRLVRLYKGVKQLNQNTQMIIPADPRLIEYAMSSNKMLLHKVPWLKDNDDEVSATDLTDKMKELRDELLKPTSSNTIDIGDYSLFAKAHLSGAVISDKFICEDEYLQLRSKLALVISPHTAMTINESDINVLYGLLKVDV